MKKQSMPSVDQKKEHPKSDSIVFYLSDGVTTATVNRLQVYFSNPCQLLSQSDVQKINSAIDHLVIKKK